ncbi:MAG: hypothetical protein ACLT76_05535 [Clostridium fessum]
MKNFFAGGNLFFLFWNTNVLFHLFAKFKRCPDRLHHHGLRSWKTFRLRTSLMASFHGTPLIHSVLDVTGSVPLFADRLVVTRSREVHDYCQSLGIPVLIHTLPNRNEALCLGLTHMLKRGTRIYQAVSLHSAISRFCVHGHWNGYAGAISNAKYHQVTLNLFSRF